MAPGDWARVIGEVAEWSKANDSKSFEGKPSVGSNPTLSVLLPWNGVDYFGMI